MKPGTSDEVLLDNSVITLPAQLTTTSANQTYGDLIWNNNAISTITINTGGGTNATITLTGGGGSTAAVGVGGASGDLLVMGSTSTANSLTIGGNVGSGNGRLRLQLSASGNFDVVNSGAALNITAEILESGSNRNLTKTGAGKVILANTNHLTGTTTISAGILEAAAIDSLGSTTNVTINSGGTLLLSNTATTDRINDSATITMAGGKIGFSGNVTERSLGPGTGALTLAANSVIDLSGGNAVINFGDSHLASWTGGTILSIFNYTGGSDQLYFGSNSSSLTSGELAQIRFYSGDTEGTFLGTGGFTGSVGEVIPVPEASSVALACGLVGLIGWRERRRMQQSRASERHALS